MRQGLGTILLLALVTTTPLLAPVSPAAEHPAGIEHWAFTAPVRRPLPATSGATVTPNPIDAFIGARLRHANIAPSHEADRRTLIRRVYFDLTGLPPTPEEIADFIADSDPLAYEKRVDRLLASPRHGERWGRHWLDVVRFAESDGFEMNWERRGAYPYRDWVIGSFNEDKPYDQFVREQIAGDALGADPGTGFLVAGAWDRVTSPDPVLTANQRADELHDIVSTTGSAFLGLTVGCARCHDHKFDPISQVDYFRMVAVFAGVRHGERAMSTPATARRAAEVAGLKERLHDVEAKLAAYEPVADAGRTYVLVDEPQVTQVVPAIGRELHNDGAGPGERHDAGDGVRLPNVGRGYFYWTNVAGKDVFTWNPQKSGRYRIWLSWGAGHKTHARDAVYQIDADGDLATPRDRTDIARADHRHFADGAGNVPNLPLWSGFRNAGVYELNPTARIVLRGGANAGDYVAADVLLLEKVPDGAGASPVANVPALRPGLRIPRNVDRFAPVKAKAVRFTILETSDAEPCVDELEVYTAGPAPRNVALASAGAKASASGTLSGFEIHKLEHLNDGRHGNEWSWISNEVGKGWVRVEFKEAVEIDRVVWGRDRDHKYKDRLATRYKVEVADEAGVWRVVAHGSDRLPYALDGKVDPIYSLTESAKPQAAVELGSLIAKRGDVLRRLAKSAAGELVAYLGTFAQPGKTFRLSRGDPTQPKEEVAPGALASVGAKLDLPPDAPERLRRTKLAEWLTDPTNPLTARVIVNRLWHYHFGQGLVNTPSDFGNMGARPTHPELLDWLATELVAQKWKLKPIHRLICLSATYRQSSEARPDAMARDAGTTLLWRYPPRRLEAEAIRDSVLAATGKLDLTMDGPGFDVFKRNANYVRVYEPKETWGRTEWRRMVYALNIRSQQDATFGAFDCPDGAQIAPRRPTSTTPLQALNLLNGSFMLQQAELLGERLESEVGLEPARQAELGFLLALGRSPTNAERDAAARLITEHGLPAFCRTIFNANEFVYVR